MTVREYEVEFGNQAGGNQCHLDRGKMLAQTNVWSGSEGHIGATREAGRTGQESLGTKHHWVRKPSRVVVQMPDRNGNKSSLWNRDANCYHIATQVNAGVFDRDRLESWDWTGVPLNRESMQRARHQDTIQYRVFERMQDEFDVVINDDGNGEAADLVCFKDVDEGSVKLCLVHCKGAHGGVVSQDIRNFYTVCGQAQKNITARHKGIGQLYLDLKRRHEAWAQEGASRFLKGDVRLLSA